MKKSLLPLALALAFPVAAVADVTVYGRAHVSLDYLDDGADYGELNVSSNSSRLGFRGNTELSNGMTAVFQVEQQVDFNRNNGETLTTRDTFVGLRGDFGMVRVGQFDSPFKRARGPANLFGDQVGDMRNLTRVGDARFDERLPNTIHYQTPSFNGLQLNAAYSVHAGNSAVDGAKEDAISLSVTYAQGPLDLAAAYETFNQDAGRGERDGIRLAVSYDVISDLKLVAFFQTVDHDNDALDSDVIGFGAEYKLAANTRVRGHYLLRSADPEEADSSLLALGIEQRMGAARVYLNYAAVANDDNVALTPWSQARTTGVPGAPGETASGLSLGLRYDF